MVAAHLQQQATELCAAFGGPDLFLDAGALTTLGSGHLIVDVLRGACRHNLRWVPPLVITRILRDRFRAALDHGAISPDTVVAVELSVKLDLKEQKGARDQNVSWMIAGDVFMSCTMEISSRITTTDANYTATAKVRREWPNEWAAPRVPRRRPARGKKRKGRKAAK